MKVITKHGASKPTASDLLSYQEGFDTRDNVYGKHEGKELFINDNGKIIPLNQNYLKEEFVNYVLPTDTDGNIVTEGGTTVYTHDAENKKGLLAHFQQKLASVVDENDTHIADRITMGAYMIDTKNHIFSMPADNKVEFYSVDPVYLAKLKNSIEQKAVYVVDTKAALEEKIKSLAEAKKLEPGVQFIVRHDETQDADASEDAAAENDTILYVVTTPEATSDDEKVGKGELKITAQEDGSFKVASEDGTFEVTQLITLEYLFHDPVAKPIYKGMGLEVTDRNDIANTIQVGVTDTTIDVIEEAYNHGYTINSEVMGTTEVPTDSADNDKFLVDGATYANYVPFTQFTYNPDDPANPTKTTHYIDFSGFVLDEGTWD